MYHYVRPDGELSDGVRGLSLSGFGEQLDHLCRLMEPIDWPVLAAQLGRGGQLPPQCFLLTFDDGLREHRQHVADELDRRGLHGVFFVPGVTMAERRLLPAHAIHALLTALGDEKFEAEVTRELGERSAEKPWARFLDETAARRMYHYETATRARMKYLLHMILPVELRNELVGALFERHVGSQREAAGRLYLSADDVRDLHSRGHAIGGHGYEHEPLTRLSAAQRRADLHRVGQLLSATLGRGPRPLALPFGAFNADVCAATHEAGFCAAFTTQESWLTPATNPLLLPRVDTIRVQDFATARFSPPQAKVASAHSAQFASAGAIARAAPAMVPEVRPAPISASPSPDGSPGSTNELALDAKRRSSLRCFLRAYWLRPENAMWMTLRSAALRTCSWQSPSADLCCGDGVFSFLHHGGQLDADFDVFLAGCDLQRAGQAGDMYDHADEKYQPKVTVPAAVTIDLGTDLKRNLLAKARRLNLYAAVVEHDHNRPLPLPSDHFRTVYCNAAYWLTDVDGFLAEVRRVLRPDGQAILHVKLDSFRKCSPAPFARLLGKDAVDRLSGNRLASWPTLADRKTWEQRFAAAGLAVEAATPFATTLHARLWEVGLRPIAPLVARLANAADAATRAAIKHEWVAMFEELCAPLCGYAAAASGEAVELQYVLRKNPLA